MSDDSSRTPAAYQPTVAHRSRGDGQGAPPERGSSGESDQPAETLEGQLVSGRYRVEKLLGVGGMGCVYRAEHVHMRKTVALKTLHPEMTQLPEAVARFEREAIAASRIDHPNVAGATDFGHLDNGSFFLVLQYVEGQSLRDLLEAESRIPAQRAVPIARQLTSALAAAHAQGIVHRDLKPENIMLVEHDGRPDFVKVLDFGIAKLTLDSAAPGLTRMGSVFGTPDYMSPEQCMGQPVDARSDLYTVGLMLYEMLCGRRAFTAPDPVVVMGQQVTAKPPPLEADVPDEVGRIVLSLLEKDVTSRPQSATELLQLLDAWQMAEGPAGVPSSTALPRTTQTASVVQSRAVDVVEASPPTRRGAQPSPMSGLSALLRKPVRIGKDEVPTGLLLAAGGAVAAGSVVVLLVLVFAVRAIFSSSDPEAGTIEIAPSATAVSSVASAAPPEPSRSSHEATIERIESISLSKRTQEEWFELARANAELGRNAESAKAYRSVLSLKRTLRRDPVVLADLLRGAGDPEAYPIVLNLCESFLGRHGLDLLWEAWQAALKRPDQQELAERMRMKLIILSRRASPALRVAIELESTKNCEKMAGFVQRAAKEADARAAAKLESLTARTGCGDSGKDDCFPCLREDDVLERALARARSRQPPKLGETPESGY